MLSIIIPCYDDHDSVARQLGALEPHLPDHEFEIIVVDDASPNMSETVFSEFGTRFGDRLTLLRNEVNAGPGHSRNSGLEAARGIDVCFVDSDDQVDDSFLFFYREIARDHDFDVAMFKHHFQTEEDAPFSFCMNQLDENIWRRFEAMDLDDGVIPLWKVPFMITSINYPWNKFYKRHYLNQYDIRFPTLRLHEDIPFHWKAMMMTDKHFFAAAYPPIYVHNRVPDRNRATDKSDEKRLQLLDASREVLEHITRFPHLKMYVPIFLRFYLDVYGWAADNIQDSLKTTLYDRSRSLLMEFSSGDFGQYIAQVDKPLSSELGAFLEGAVE